MRINTLLIFVLAATAGCASDPVPLWRAKPVPNERVANEFKDGGRKITIVRDDDYSIEGCAFSVKLDGIPAGTILRGESLNLRMAKGNPKKIFVETKGCLSVAEKEMTLENDGDIALRINFKIGGSIGISPMSEESLKKRLLDDLPY